MTKQQMQAHDVATLWAAATRPHEVGNYARGPLADCAAAPFGWSLRHRVISPLEGEMSGRTEGGAKDRGPEGCF